MEIREITEAKEFYREINSEIPTVVDFYATWCAPCKLQSPILYELGEAIDGKAKIIKVDVDAVPEIADKMKITSIPTLSVFVSGAEKEKSIGLTPKARLSDMLIKYL